MYVLGLIIPLKLGAEYKTQTNTYAYMFNYVFIVVVTDSLFWKRINMKNITTLRTLLVRYLKASFANIFFTGDIVN